METLFDLSATSSSFLIGLVVWEMIWKAFGLWRAGRRNQPAWFFLMFILNTAGILPIVYLFVTREKKAKIQKVISKKKK